MINMYYDFQAILWVWSARRGPKSLPLSFLYRPYLHPKEIKFPPSLGSPFSPFFSASSPFGYWVGVGVLPPPILTFFKTPPIPILLSLPWSYIVGGGRVGWKENLRQCGTLGSLFSSTSLVHWVIVLIESGWGFHPLPLLTFYTTPPTPTLSCLPWLYTVGGGVEGRT